MRAVARLTFDQMTKPVATAGRIRGEHFDEVGLFYAQVEYLWSTDFVARYNWKGPTMPLGEARMMMMPGDDRQVLPLRGNRDQGQTTPEQLGDVYPEGLDFLTHARSDTPLEFLKQSGLSHLWCSVNVVWL